MGLEWAGCCWLVVVGQQCPWHNMLPVHPAWHAHQDAGGPALPPPLQRIIGALRQLPHAAQLAAPHGSPPTLSAQQCAAMPLAGNPMLFAACSSSVQEGLSDLAAIGVHTLGRLMRLDSLLCSHPTSDAWIRGPWCSLKFPQSMRWCAVDLARLRVGEVLEHVPALWQHLARNAVHMDAWPQLQGGAVHLPPQDFQHVAMLLSDCVGWSVPGVATPVPLHALSVGEACRGAAAPAMGGCQARTVEPVHCRGSW
jgi:hypothetical protein